MNSKIITSRILSDLEKSIIKDFLAFCVKKLELKKLPPEIRVFKNRENGMTTGGYNPNDHKISVLGGRRLLLDILRSIAHELTHHKQNERGNLHQLLQEYPEDLYSPYENEAYEMSGNIIKEWSRIIRKENRFPVEIYEIYY